MKTVLDTNILIDLTKGYPQAEALIYSLDDVAISTVSWIETMIGVRNERDRVVIQQMLEIFPIIETNREIAQHAISIRQQYRLHLPDAMIWATAKHLGACLLTRDTGYPSQALDIQIPYTL